MVSAISMCFFQAFCTEIWSYFFTIHYGHWSGLPYGIFERGQWLCTKMKNFLWQGLDLSWKGRKGPIKNGCVHELCPKVMDKNPIHKLSLKSF